LNEDKEIIYEKIREAIIKLEHEQPQEQQQQPAPHYEKIQGHQAEDEDLFDEINNSYIAETVNRVNDVERENQVSLFICFNDQYKYGSLISMISSRKMILIQNR